MPTKTKDSFPHTPLNFSPDCYTQAPNLPTLEANIKEAITAYLLPEA